MKFPTSSESILLSIYQHTICVSVCVKQALLGVCVGDCVNCEWGIQSSGPLYVCLDPGHSEPLHYS